MARTQRELTPRDYEIIGLPKSLHKAKVKLLSESGKRAKPWLDAIESNVIRGVTLFVLGDAGSGKSSVAAIAALRATRLGFEARWFTCHELVSAWRQHDFEPADKFVSADLSVLDDLREETLKSPFGKDLLALVRARSQNRKATVITVAPMDLGDLEDWRSGVNDAMRVVLFGTFRKEVEL